MVVTRYVDSKAKVFLFFLQGCNNLVTRLLQPKLQACHNLSCNNNLVISVWVYIIYGLMQAIVHVGT